MSINNRVYILGEADNLTSYNLITNINKNFPDISVVLLVINSSILHDWKRLLRKLKNAGVLSTLQRVFSIIKKRIELSFSFKRSLAQKNANKVDLSAQARYRIARFNSYSAKECLDYLKKQQVRFLISNTDVIISTKLIQAIPDGIWNAHPGALPAYRGLGAAAKMLADGFFPVVSLHLIDEGIDSGPLYMEREVKEISNLVQLEQAIMDSQSSVFCELINTFQSSKRPVVQDIFCYPSRVTHFNTKQTRIKALHNLQQGNLRSYSPADH